MVKESILTNQVTIKGWSLVVTLVNMAWRVVLATSMTLVGFLAGRWLG
jgi:uncharacterized membrane protein